LWIMNNRAQLVCLDFDGFADGVDDGLLQPEVADNPAEADIVWVLDLRKQLHVIPHLVTSTSPTLAGDLILVGTSHGRRPELDSTAVEIAPSFVAVERDTGRIVWQDDSPGLNILDGQWSSPAWSVIDGVAQAIFGGGDGWVYSFDLNEIQAGRTKLLWKFDCNPKTSIYRMGRTDGGRNTLIATPVIDGNRVYMATGHNPEYGDGPGIVWCIDATGRGDLSETLVFHSDAPRTPLPPRRLQSCDPAAGEYEQPNPNTGMIWKYNGADLNQDGKLAFEEEMHAATSSVTVANGMAIIADGSGVLHCLDAWTGQALWIHDAFSAIHGTPLVNHDQIYVGTEDGDLLKIPCSRTFEGVTQCETGRSIMGSLVAANNRLLVPQMGNLLSLGKPPAGNDQGAELSVPQVRRWTADDHSAIAIQTADECRLILYFPGRLRSEWISRTGAEGEWVYRGWVRLRPNGGSERLLEIQYGSEQIGDVTVNEQTLSLADGQLLSIGADGSIVQLTCGTPLKSQRDVRRMGEYVAGARNR
ncbi:MAG: PQQ-binding-like beta-propeller repeat protein, partial [Planctomycetaceae bacterium]|nr:PQQ-binding-like beta-propeller repeat protein [Planctomycetaceae bacterium]